MTQVMGSPNLVNLTPEQPIPDDVMIAPDRKGGWKVRHAYAMDWIEGIPMRGLADQILEAFNKIAEEAYVRGL